MKNQRTWVFSTYLIKHEIVSQMLQVNLKKLTEYNFKIYKTDALLHLILIQAWVIKCLSF